VKTDWQRIQRWAGVEADGAPGPATARAIIAKAGIVPEKHALSDPEAFFAGVRDITGRLDQVQVDTLNRLLDSAAHWRLSWLAYGMATAWHEALFRPIREYDRGGRRPYAKPGEYGQPQYGRGLVQLTWDANYKRADEELGLNGSLLRNFDRALEPEIAAAILVRGMEEGWFTGKALQRYLPNEKGTAAQFHDARRIINGTDKAAAIALLALQFQAALQAGDWA